MSADEKDGPEKDGPEKDGPEEAEEAGRTVFIGGSSTPMPSAPPPAPKSSGGRVEVGQLLNHMFEVKRFIARGGMGEVYEGCNVASDERVAIKVMLPALAADPNVQAMFKKEARTLTALSHPALVQYRALAQEPILGVLYIVTEFVDGPTLSNVLGTLEIDAAALKRLTRRLAEGLRAAHAVGAVHRDIAPDNVLLCEGKLEEAKIIDFGIAKDLDPTKATIVGDGFAGKLGYVAPEQFGDYGREVGPWTDVYSLALVILAVAEGRDVDMGSTLVEAVDKRRAGVDLANAPPELRPVLARMLEPDPAKRFRSMDEVIAALDRTPQPEPEPAPRPAPPPEQKTVFVPAPKPAPQAMPPTASSLPAGSAAEPGASEERGRSKLPLLMGAGVAALVLAGGLAWMLWPAADGPAVEEAEVAQGPAALSLERVREAIEAALPATPCAWLDITSLSGSPDNISVALTGVAASPPAAQRALTEAVQSVGARLGNVDLEDVAPVQDAVCTPLDAFGDIRADTSAAGRRLESVQRKFEMTRLDNGTFGARAVIGMRIGDRARDFALIGLEPTGVLDPLVLSRADFEAARAQFPDGIRETGEDSYQISLDTDHTGWSGLLLLTGQGPFPDDLVTPPVGNRGEAWRERFRATAQERNWRAEMVWYRTVDESPD